MSRAMPLSIPPYDAHSMLGAYSGGSDLYGRSPARPESRSSSLWALPDAEIPTVSESTVGGAGPHLRFREGDRCAVQYPIPMPERGGYGTTKNLMLPRTVSLKNPTPRKADSSIYVM